MAYYNNPTPMQSNNDNSQDVFEQAVRSNPNLIDKYRKRILLQI